MEKMLVIVFDDEKKAYEGSRALYELDIQGQISIHGEAVIAKSVDGRVTCKEVDGDFPIRTVAGTTLGSLIGLLGGPVGLAIGVGAGTFAGMLADLQFTGVGAEFIDDVSKALKPGKYAVVADVNEEWVTPVDTRMEALGGVVYRTARSSVVQEQAARDRATLDAELAAIRAEHAKAQADRKKKLQSKIEQLETRLQTTIRRHQEQREKAVLEIDAKLAAVERRAAQAQGNAKATLDARATELRREYELGKAKQRAVGSAPGHH